RRSVAREHRTGVHANGVLIIDETGGPQAQPGLVLAAQHLQWQAGHTADGVVSVTRHWAAGTLHVPLGVRPYRPLPGPLRSTLLQALGSACVT
ncbi:MAG: hypothetical protein J2P58_13715, partial [Acidimicrobiaceae bacterium]|nr:hypothetical protein [Acidimicrobiaceae bacterium]